MVMSAGKLAAYRHLGNEVLVDIVEQEAEAVLRERGNTVVVVPTPGRDGKVIQKRCVEKVTSADVIDAAGNRVRKRVRIRDGKVIGDA